MVMPFTAPDHELLVYSNETLLVCSHRGNQAREVVRAKDILSVVAMVPLPMTPAEARAALEDAPTRARYASRFFVVEKPGLDIARIAGRIEDPAEDEDGFNVE